jgi:hypothetical protein
MPESVDDALLGEDAAGEGELHADIFADTRDIVVEGCHVVVAAPLRIGMTRPDRGDVIGQSRRRPH